MDWIAAQLYVTKPEYAMLAACFVMSVLAAWTDASRHLIPNTITYPGMLAGAVLTLITGTDPAWKLIVFLAWFLIGPLLFGEGDIKLLMAAALLSPPFLHLVSFVLSQVLLLAAALVMWIFRREKENDPEEPSRDEGKETKTGKMPRALPLGPCFAAAVLCVLVALYAMHMIL